MSTEPAGIILYTGMYDVQLCRVCPSFVFVFGDNVRGFGKGGQAIIRDEPNAFGIPTKRAPTMAESAFFKEGNDTDLNHVLGRLHALWDVLRDTDKTVVIPMLDEARTSLGALRAELPQRAPTIYATINMHIREMCAAEGATQIDTATQLRKEYVKYAG